MLKKVLLKIQKLEQKKKVKIDKQATTQKEIDDLDMTLKKLYSFKKEYEKLENNSKEYLENINGKVT